MSDFTLNFVHASINSAVSAVSDQFFYASSADDAFRDIVDGIENLAPDVIYGHQAKAVISDSEFTSDDEAERSIMKDADNFDEALRLVAQSRINTASSDYTSELIERLDDMAEALVDELEARGLEVRDDRVWVNRECSRGYTPHREETDISTSLDVASLLLWDGGYFFLEFCGVTMSGHADVAVVDEDEE